ncbi:MAG: sulfotransferase [Arcobacteraceae bacterium]|nr:sulfotransferase [Arcobacteraceae bacterium]
MNLLNETLYNENKKLLSKFTKESYPIYFIIAQPRGASALLQQLLTSNLEVGYISNFLAKFYKAPLFGIELEKSFIDKNYKSSFLSQYGNTDGINEPHEWGWFWKDMLDLKGDKHYTNMNNFDFLKQNLISIANTKELPLIIDNVFALSNLIKIKKSLPNIKIINMTRDLYFICNSIINARLSKSGNIDIFYGHPPKNIEEVLKIKNPIEQIVFQVKSIQNEIDAIVNNFEEEQTLHIDYEDIYTDSFSVVEKFHTFVKKDNINLNFKKKHLPQLSYRNSSDLIKSEYKEELDLYYKKYFGNKHD